MKGGAETNPYFIHIRWLEVFSCPFFPHGCSSLISVRAGGRTPRPPVRGGGSRMLRGLMLRRRAVLSTPKCEKSVGRRGSAPDPVGGAYNAPPDPLAGGEGALLPRPQEPHLQYCHCACPVCMYTRVWKCTVIFSWMLNAGPHSCIWGASNYLAPALLPIRSLTWDLAFFFI